MRLISQGAESRLFINEEDGISNIIIKERFSKLYRIRYIDNMISKQRHKAEIKALKKCQEFNILAPKFLNEDNTKYKIYMEYINGNTLKSELANDNNVQKLLIEFGVTIAKLHENGIIHGDLTSSNFLIKRNHNNFEIKLYAIDFGLTKIFEHKNIKHLESSSTLEDKAVDLYVMEKAFTSTHYQLEQYIFTSILPSYASFVNVSRKNLYKQKYTKNTAKCDYLSDSASDQEIDISEKFFEQEFLSKYKNTPVYSIFTKFIDVRKRGRKRSMIG